jgi:putative ABC transport system substrate-binding protein
VIYRRRFLQLATLIAIPRAAAAQPPGKAYRLGILGLAREHPLIGPFFDALREVGWVDGRNLSVEFRPTGGDPARADAAARELVALKVDLIVTYVTGNAVAAKRNTADIPIVMLTSGYPVEVGLAASYARPGGNLTGNTAYAGTGFFGKHVEILKTLVPRLSRLAVIWSYLPPIVEGAEGDLALTELKQAAATLGIATQVLETKLTPEDVDRALATISAARVDALFVSAVTGLPEIAGRIVKFAQERRLPAITDFAANLTRAGILITYSANTGAIVRQTARFVDRILRGARPGELPIERPSKFDLIINVKTAKSIRLVIPPSLLLRADQVIE